MLVFAYGQLPKKYYRRLLVGIFAFVVTVVILLVLIQVLGYISLFLCIVESHDGQVVLLLCWILLMLPNTFQLSLQFLNISPLRGPPSS